MNSYLSRGLMCILVYVMSGCSDRDYQGVELTAQSATSETKEAEASQAKERSGVRKPVIPETAPEPMEPFIMINDGAGLINGNFTEYFEDVIPYWTQEFNTIRVKSAAGPDMSPAAFFQGKYNYELLYQEIHFSEPPAGYTLTFSADVRTSEAEKTRLMIKLPDGTERLSEFHPGDDGFHNLSVSYQFPQTYTDTQAKVVIVHGRSPQKFCFADNAKLSLAR